jgi:hypothetical protein
MLKSSVNLKDHEIFLLFYIFFLIDFGRKRGYMLWFAKFAHFTPGSFFKIHLFTCAYIVWVVSPPCLLPPATILCPPPSLASRLLLILIKTFRLHASRMSLGEIKLLMVWLFVDFVSVQHWFTSGHNSPPLPEFVPLVMTFWQFPLTATVNFSRSGICVGLVTCSDQFKVAEVMMCHLCTRHLEAMYVWFVTV